MMRRRFLVISTLGVGVFLALLITAGASMAGDTVFSGGTLDDLRQLSPTLSFDHLRITGILSLPAGGSATLNVNKLTITESGGVSYTYSDCTYLPAPDFTVQATGDVVVNGDISVTIIDIREDEVLLAVDAPEWMEVREEDVLEALAPVRPR